MRFRKIAMRTLQLVILGSILAVFAACSGSYDDPASDTRSSYYAADSAEPALVSQNDLKRWIDRGYYTDNNRKVVIIDATHTAPAKYIPGAVRPPIIDELKEWGMGRSDGPVLNLGNQVLDGAAMDQILQYAGIDLDTVVVFTSNGWATANLGNQSIRAWWTFYYWGFAKASLKLLDGGNDGFRAEFGEGVMTNYARVPQPSKFSVRDLPGNRIDRARAAFGDVLSGAADGAYERREQIIINTQGYTTDNLNSNCYGGANGAAPCYNGSGAFTGLVGGALLLNTSPGMAVFGTQKNGLYGTYYIFKGPGDANPVKLVDYNSGYDVLARKPDLGTRIITYCGNGQSGSMPWFYLVNILGYSNAALYDGGNSEWLNLPAYRYDNGTGMPITDYVSSAPVATRTYLKWDAAKNRFRSVKDNSIAARIVPYNDGPFYGWMGIGWDTSRYSDYVSFPVVPVTYLAVDPDYKGSGREIHEADKMYQKSKPSDDGAFSGGGGGAGGC